jgi:hypothetical protein
LDLWEHAYYPGISIPKKKLHWFFFQCN